LRSVSLTVTIMLTVTIVLVIQAVTYFSCNDVQIVRPILISLSVFPKILIISPNRFAL